MANSRREKSAETIVPDYVLIREGSNLSQVRSNESYPMKGRMQTILNNETSPQKNRTVSEGYVGGQTYIGITESTLTNKHFTEYGLMEFILSPSNLNQAYLRVKPNQGAGGVDKMETESLKDYLVTHKEELIHSILEGNYRPNPVRRVKYPRTMEVNASWVSPRLLTESSSRLLPKFCHLFTRNSIHQTAMASVLVAVPIRHSKSVSSISMKIIAMP